MQHARFGLLLLAVVLLAAATVIGIAAMPAQARLWLIPLLMLAAVAVRALGWRS